jgi:DivIVA domain-containing protein
MGSGEPPEPGQSGSDEAGVPEEPEDAGERPSGRSEIGDVSFPVAVRGYERKAVDAYVERVRQVVADLELARSPEAAVRHALEQVGEQTKGILEGAGEAAEQITVSARQEAEASTARARSEADEVVTSAKAEEAEILAHSRAEADATVAQARDEAAEHLQRSREEVAALRQQAELRLGEIRADTETIREERRQLLADIRQIATRVEEVAAAADARFAPAETADEASEGIPRSEPAGEGDPTEVKAAQDPGAEQRTPRQSTG